MDSKAFLKNVLSFAQKEKQIKQDPRYTEMIAKFDEAKFNKKYTQIKKDNFSELCYRLILADEVFDYSQTGKEFIPSIYKFLNCNYIILNQVFGKFENSPTPDRNYQDFWFSEKLFLIDGIIYELHPQSALFGYLYTHFECSKCLRFNGTFLIAENFEGTQKIENKLSEYFKFNEL